MTHYRLHTSGQIQNQISIPIGRPLPEGCTWAYHKTTGIKIPVKTPA